MKNIYQYGKIVYCSYAAYFEIPDINISKSIINNNHLRNKTTGAKVGVPQTKKGIFKPFDEISCPVTFKIMVLAKEINFFNNNQQSLARTPPPLLPGY